MSSRKRFNLQPTAVPTQVNKKKKRRSPSSSSSESPPRTISTRRSKRQKRSPSIDSSHVNGKEEEEPISQQNHHKETKHEEVEGDEGRQVELNPEEEERERILSRVEIRPIEIDDLAKVWQLGEELYVTHSNLYRTWDSYTVTELFSSDPEYCLVADYKDKVIAFVLGTTIAKASWKYGYIVWLGVAKEFQRYGIARKIYNEMERIMKESGAKIIIIDTQADNIPAIKFFEKIGFRNPQKCVFLSRDLTNAAVTESITHPQVQVNIRELQLKDVAEVYHLGESIFTASKAQSHYRSWDEYVVVDFFNSDAEYCLVAELKGKVVGFALGSVIQKTKMKHGYITWLGVKDKLRRKGIGTALFLAMINRMMKDGATMLLVDTELDNKPALKFFSKMGFENPVNHIYLDHNIAPTKKESED